MVFDKKGKAEEAKNALDQEITFKACIKRNKVVGHYIGKNILNLNDNDLAIFPMIEKNSTLYNHSISCVY